MTILFLTPRIPYPPYRGDKLKIWNLLRQLSKRHKIVLVSFIQHESERAYESQLKNVCEQVHLIRLPRWRSYLNCLVALFQRIPFQVAYYKSAKMKELFERVLAEVKPEIIHTHLIRMAQYTAAHTAFARVLDMTDAVSLYLSRFSSVHRNPVIRWLIAKELKRMVSYEPIIARFDRSLVCSENDREFLLKHIPEANIDLLYNGIDLETFSVNGKVAQEPHRIIFTGNMSYFPNSDGAKFFAGEVLPLVKAKIPDAKLYIVGQDPPASVSSLASQGIVVTGFVENIQREYLKSAVAVSPIRFGAGTLNKILEPLALGVPVVSTPIGIDGLGLNVGKEILVAANPREFAESIVNLLSDAAYHKKIAGSAARKIRTRFSWEKIAKDLEQVYRAIQKKKKKGR